MTHCCQTVYVNELFSKKSSECWQKKNLITGILKINIFYKFPNTFLLLLKEPLKTENLKFKIKKN